MAGKLEDIHASEGLRRIIRNIGWLLGGKGFAAIVSLVYLAILARSLGLKGFGHFSLIFGTAQAMVAIAGFQTWQTIVRFGARHLTAKKEDRFARLAVFGGAIDIIGSVLGTLFAGIVIYGFGDQLELNPRYVTAAFLFIATLLFARGTAPTGIIRVLDRYDLAVAAGAITPVARLFAALYIWNTGATVVRFLLAWGAIELFSAGLLWAIAYRLQKGNLKFSDITQWRRTVRENPGLLGFLGVTYASQTIQAVLQHGPLLAVGYFLGTRAAGVYRIADQLAKALSKLATLVTQAIYPEVNRQKHQAPEAEFQRLITRISLIVFGAGALIVLIALLVGRQVLELIGGPEFSQGAPLLLPLAIAASFDLAAVAFEPVLHAHGKAHWSLGVRLFGVAAMTLSTALFVGFGVIGVSWAVALAFAVIYLAFAIVVRRAILCSRGGA
ncbi:lipopolysaccharide biosynthesis protein [Erythrobacter litoralis]|uniref:lipopolysaccharide biosynthesis protein n=1 Tax=Erythrobacter litoralis TaxID=39960 RepID=UPI002434D480|nr:oligosaccharide flippase family protein [Erythrobacter litoralis]